MTPAEEYLRAKNISPRILDEEDTVLVMNNFAYETLKNLYNALGEEMDTVTILQTISNYKAKFHHCEEVS